MSTPANDPRAAAQHEAEIHLTAGQLPGYIGPAVFVVALVVSATVLGLLGAFGWIATVLLAVIGFLVAMFALSTAVEGRRRAVDRIARYLILGTFLLALAPLLSLLFKVASEGIIRFDVTYFTSTKRNVIGAGGGAAHAIIGTLITTGMATVFSVPVGLLTAIYLVEYGKGWMKRVITFLVDVMTGIPSIVAGLFAYSLISLMVGHGSKSGLAGALALSVLMIPYVVRNSEEIIRLVPDKLREASYGLGVSKWRTIVKVVLPTSVSGIVSGVVLAIARIIGETAPLLITMGFTASMTTNPLPTGGSNMVNPMTSLPVFVFYEYTRPGRPQEAFLDRAWTGALVLVLIVMVLNLIGRWVARKYAPKINR
ncbi:phosphate ABC transporter, permease PstA [Propionibacterium sp. oral taxon 192 str. F0372]|uniref:phosphate ABC transporter permease PstA n=1 Tax=Propionibacterium sp. oral taxon 192 TaxID=671222 RepID=UPI0003534C44|nr:phosphate ABC transporter permease PstA [Propionibacterium sp. oral taxon 192]EPH03322.1 phosphate ABC transporter, permease PstA [Propionibacterium sp. oral taxon 192 str. F0372]